MRDFHDWLVRSGLAGLLAVVAMSLPLLLVGCAQMQEQAEKARAFWCDPSTGRVPTYAALVRTLKPEVSPQVRQAVAAAEAACAANDLPIDLVVAKAVLAGLAVEDVGK